MVQKQQSYYNAKIMAYSKQNEQWPDFGCEGIKVQRAGYQKIYIGDIFGFIVSFYKQLLKNLIAPKLTLASEIFRGIYGNYISKFLFLSIFLQKSSKLTKNQGSQKNAIGIFSWNKQSLLHFYIKQFLFKIFTSVLVISTFPCVML
eukprot:TRINITY_DN4289_c2_g1_i2.p5 TRINITY_DN4289_c2_g1~~TRINITY_DN4289_c2_g1_i2.p5  ORF type:complete len:146 (+),score=4.32 TRINITY_DN4289_c2_g1_i2:707-1144(+)